MRHHWTKKSGGNILRQAPGQTERMSQPRPPMKKRTGQEVAACPTCGHVVLTRPALFADDELGIHERTRILVNHSDDGARCINNGKRTPCFGSGSKAVRPYTYEEEQT